MRKMAYAAVALITLAVISCDGGKDPGPGPQPVKYTVTFDKNNTDPGGTDPNPKTKEVEADKSGEAKIGALPTTNPSRPKYGFKNYNFAKDGSGNLVGVNSVITGNTVVYAQWEFAPFVDAAPAMEAASGNASGSTLDSDGNIKLFKGDSFDYKFPTAVYEADGVTPSYDFYKVFYTLADRNWDNSGQQGSETSVFIRQYRTSTLYTGWSNASNLMPWLSNNNNPLILEIKGAGTTGGFRIYGNCNGDMTFSVDSVIFYKAPRHTVTFNYNYTGKTTMDDPEPITNVWGPYEGHPGYSLGNTIPTAPDRSTETDAAGNPAPQYFLGWFDGTTEYTDTTPITQNITLKGKWTTTVPDKVEKITVNNNSAVPIYRFTISDGWGNATKGVSKITYKIWVNDNETANRMHIVAPLTGIATNGSKILSSWGDYRLINVAGSSNVTAILAKGKNKSGNAGSTGEWVTYEYVIGPTLAVVSAPESTAFKAENYPSADTTKIYIGLGLSSNANTVVYYIRDVALILSDGTIVANDSLDITDNGSKLGVFYFAAAGTHPVVTRIISNSPGE